MIEWHWQPFHALDVHTLYTLLAARSAVFVMEQQCLYADLDGQDQSAWHLYGCWQDARAGTPACAQDVASAPRTPVSGSLAASARILPPDADEASVRIGRVLTTPGFRGQGLGRVLLEQALERIAGQWPGVPVRLHAQAHLQAFYGAQGFIATAPIDIEDNIEHVWMQRG